MGRGDGAALAALLDDQTDWVILGEGNLAGTYRGPSEIFGFWKDVARKTGGGLKLEVRDVLGNDERVVVLVNVHGEREGRRLNEKQVVVFELRGDKVKSATFIYERADVYDAFWA